MRNAIGDNINAIRIDRGLTQRELAERLGVKQTTVSSWECGKSLPSKPNIERIESAFGVSFDLVVSDEGGYAAKRRERRMKRMRALHAVAEDAPTAPVLGPIAAGKPADMQERADAFFVPKALKDRYPRAFYLIVRGNSMNRTMPDGCLALVDPLQREANPHDAFAVRIGREEATVKRVRATEDGIELVPDSFDPSFAPIAFVNGSSVQDVEILGKVVWVTTPFDYRA